MNLVFRLNLMVMLVILHGGLQIFLVVMKERSKLQLVCFVAPFVRLALEKGLDIKLVTICTT